MAPRPDETLLSEVNPFLEISSIPTKLRHEDAEEGKVKDEKEQILDAIGSK